MRLIKTLTTAAVAFALLLVPGAALAKQRDRNHDRLPDKWETAHHLSLRVNQARRDQDHDGLNNMAEFKDGTNPRNADTDGDGVNDGTEVEDHTNPDNRHEFSGTVVSFDNTTGALTIQLPGDGAGTVTGTVNDQTRIECGDNEGDNSAQMSSHGSDDGSGDDNGGNTGSGDGGNSGSNSGSDDGSNTQSSGDDNAGSSQSGSGSDDGNNEQGDDNGQGDDNNAGNACTSADLTPGAQVREAKTDTAADGSTVFTKIELAPPAPAPTA
jgi:hypothetical protein